MTDDLSKTLSGFALFGLTSGILVLVAFLLIDFVIWLLLQAGLVG